jgi:hypothetical protein
MKIKDLKEWFANIPVEFDELDIQDIDVDHTRPVDILNLVELSNGRANIKTLFLKKRYNKK